MSKDKIDILAKHDVLATFLGIEHRGCMFKTADCPDKCEHPADLAIFNVIEYKNYELLGQYGDEKQEQIYVEVTKPVYHQDPKIAEICKKLKKGQKVRLVYHHLYVNDGFNQRPERPVISITEV